MATAKLRVRARKRSTLADWTHFLQEPGVVIRTEAGSPVTSEEMLKIMGEAFTDAGRPLTRQYRPDPGHYVTSGGNVFSCRPFH